MSTVTCPKCGTENPSDTKNCKSCRVNLEFALKYPAAMPFARQHPEKFGLTKQKTVPFSAESSATHLAQKDVGCSATDGKLSTPQPSQKSTVSNSHVIHHNADSDNLNKIKHINNQKNKAVNILCKIGLHKWSTCVCYKCGKPRAEGHDWAKDCEKCAKCGKAITDAHQWTDCKCSKCGMTRHDWSADCEKCIKCGTVRQNVHSWSGCKCLTCGKTSIAKANELLLDAAATGNLVVVKNALAAGAHIDVDNRDTDGRADGTALISAARKGHLTVVNALLAAGAFTAAWDRNGYTPLITAANQGHFEIVKALLAADAFVNARTNDGYTALSCASYRYPEIVKVLLAAGAEPNTQDYKGDTPLMHASYFGQIATVKALLAAGANVNAINRDGSTALIQAAVVSFGGNHLDIVKALLASGADVSVRHCGKTALEYAYNRSDIVQALLAAGK